MHQALPWIGSLTMLLLFLHETEAQALGEYRMFRFLRPLPERTQYLVFFYAHFALYGLMLAYLWTVWNQTSPALWVLVNSILVLHLGLHLLARAWPSNVFKKTESWLVLIGLGASGALGLILSPWYGS